MPEQPLKLAETCPPRERSTIFAASHTLKSIPEHGTILAFDFGLKRIGIAVGEVSVKQSHPLTTVEAVDNATRFSKIAELITEWQPILLIVGYPVHMDGTPHELTARAQRFANQLAGRFRLPVSFADERLTSVAADAYLHESSSKRYNQQTSLTKNKKQAHSFKLKQDAIAAQLILTTWFEHIQEQNANV